MKKLTQKALKTFRDRLYLEIPDADLEGDLPPYHHPGADSEEVEYMLERRRAGWLDPAEGGAPPVSRCPSRICTTS